ncbi:MAG: DUF2191 domain-containing protein [Chloroflexota bacterium]|nr:DUF2191 domain-containing protein [Chloroflexota bacterium]
MGQRTTLTLEEDIVDRLRSEALRTGRPFKAVVNEAIRVGLDRREHQASRGASFRVEPLDLGLRPGIELDDIEGLLDQLEGKHRR